MSERRTKPSLDNALGELPVFPLPRVVLFPGAPLPLHIFEPRYRAMLADCLESHGALAIAHVDVSSGGDRLARVAGGGIVVEHQPLPDGRANIVVVGVTRVFFEEILNEELPRYPYKRAQARILHDLDVEAPLADRTALIAAATMFATEVRKHDPNFAFRIPSPAESGALADACAFQLIVDANARQAVLEELDPRERVQMVMNQLALQHGAMLSEFPGKVLN